MCLNEQLMVIKPQSACVRAWDVTSRFTMLPTQESKHTFKSLRELFILEIYDYHAELLFCCEHQGSG